MFLLILASFGPYITQELIDSLSRNPNKLWLSSDVVIVISCVDRVLIYSICLTNESLLTVLDELVDFLVHTHFAMSLVKSWLMWWSKYISELLETAFEAFLETRVDFGSSPEVLLFSPMLLLQFRHSGSDIVFILRFHWNVKVVLSAVVFEVHFVCLLQIYSGPVDLWLVSHRQKTEFTWCCYFAFESWLDAPRWFLRSFPVRIL